MIPFSQKFNINILLAPCRSNSFKTTLVDKLYQFLPIFSIFYLITSLPLGYQ